MSNIGILLVATNKYKQFVSPLVDTIKEYFLVDDDVTIFLFSDRPAAGLPVFNLKIPNLTFPDATLKRYHIFLNFSHLLIDQDYLYYMDVDSKIVSKVDKEILPDAPNQLVLCRHPGFWEGGGSWETRVKSMCYVKPEDRLKYYAGGFLGAKATTFLKVAAELKEMIHKDLLRGITPVWHDESALNCLAVTYPNIKELPPAYIYPESKKDWFTWPGTPKILALDKDHENIRKE